MPTKTGRSVKVSADTRREIERLRARGRKLLRAIRSRTETQMPWLKEKNPRVRRVGKGTGWIKAKAVRVVKRGNKIDVQVKR